MWMGSCVRPPGNAAQLLLLRILFEVMTLVYLFVINLVKIFLVDSNRVIGLVLLISLCHSVGLGIGYIVPFDQSPGTSPVSNMLLKKLTNTFIVSSLKCFMKKYGIPDGPGAFSFPVPFIMLDISSASISSTQLSYQSFLILFCG